jgi:soluble lytic murein transglycosylase
VKPFFAVLIIAALSITLFSQTADELHASVRAAVSERRYVDALSGLKRLEKEHPEIFRLNNLDYLTARLSERNRDNAAAAAYYLAVVKRGSLLKPYALYHLAGVARGSGNLILERTYLDELIAFHPGSLLTDAARNRRARSWFESGNFAEAAKAFESLAAGALRPGAGKGGDAAARENRLFLARSYLLAGNTTAAREILAALIGSTANPAQPDDIALEAVKALDRLELGAEKDRKVPLLNDFEHLRRASIYQFNRDFPDARDHYAAIIADHPASGIVPDAIFQTGRGHAQEGNFPEAIRWYERVIEQFPDHPVSADSRLQAASSYARVGKYRESVRRYQDFIAKYPGDERLDRAYLNIIDVLRDEGSDTEALQWAVKTRETFRGKLAETQALFSEMRINLARSDWDAAIAGLDKLAAATDLGGANVPGGTNRDEVAFLHALALEQKRSYREAIDAYLSLPDGRAAYYGWRATERLQALANGTDSRAAAEAKLNELAAPAVSKDSDVHRRSIQSAIRLTTDAAQKSRLLEQLRTIYASLPTYRKLPEGKPVNIGRTELRKAAAASTAKDPHRALAEELAFLGLYDEAAPELEADSTAGTGTEDPAYTLAVMNRRGDRAHRSVGYAEPRWRSVPADYQVELLPREGVELLYPAPFADTFIRHSVPRDVDPRFLLSIVRQESRYRPDIKSNAAARGMMQFISTTSDKIAAELGRGDFVQDELYEPGTAILFGAQYVSDLFKMFPNQPDAVSASYNGGEDNMRRWMKRSKSDYAGLYVPEIAFAQSKDYVYKVMAAYRIYLHFYDEKLNLRPGV